MDDYQTKELPSDNTWHGYQIIKEIGRGGMGCVYKAFQTELKRTVALKITLTASSQTSNRRFVREMKIAAQLDHPNICKIYDAGIIDDKKYMVMDYIEGLSLKEYLKQHDLSVEEKIRLMMKICAALSYAHQRKIVHRDLKPENIMMDKNNEPIVIDFGLARRVDSSEFDLTKTGDVVGTPYYMAPEQIAGLRKNITHQVDIYAMGVILYEVLTGKRMMEGANVFEVMCRIHDRNYVPLRVQNPELSRDLQTIWEKATYPERKYRYANIDLLSLDLQAFLNNKRVKKSPHKQMRMLSYGLAILCITMITFLFMPRNDRLLVNIKLSRAAKERLQERLRYFEAILTHIDKREFDVAEHKYKARRLSPSQYITLVKELYEKNEYDRAFALLSEVEDRVVAKYYKAIILYHKQQYKLAEKILRKLPGYANKNYYLGLCLYHIARKYNKFDLFGEVLTLLEKKKYQDDINVLVALAAIHRYRKSQVAKEYFQKCVAKEPFAAKHSVPLARIYIQENRHYDAFVLIRKILDSDNTLNAYEVLHEIPYYEPTLNRFCYQTVVNGFFRDIQLHTPHLFLQQCVAVQQGYRERYTSWLRLQVPQQSSLATIFDKLPNASLEVQKLLKKAMMNLRYSRNFHQQIENFIAQDITPQIENFLREVQKQARREKDKEIMAMILYRLARIEQNRAWSQSEWRHSDMDTLFHYVLSNGTSVFEKYLLVKGILHFYGVAPLIKILHDDGKDAILRTIVAATFREYHLAAKIDVFFQLPQMQERISSAREQEFFKILIARSMYVTHAYKHLDTFYRKINYKERRTEVSRKERDLLLYLMTDSSLKVRVIAAGSLHGLMDERQDAKTVKMSRDVLTRWGMRATQNVVRAYSHFIFWQKKQVIQPEYLPLYRAGLQDPSMEVKKTVLGFHLKVGSYIPKISKELEKCLTLSPEIRRLALFALVMNKRSKKLIFEEKFYPSIAKDFLPVEHSMVFLTTLYRIMDDFKSTNKIDFSTIKKLIDFMNYTKTYIHSLPPSSQCMISYILTMFNVHTDHAYLDKINDPFLLSYLLFQLQQEAIFSNQMPKGFVKSPTLKERKDIAKEYLKYPHAKVKQFATTSYISLGDENVGKNYVRIAKKWPKLKRFVALGIRGFTERRWLKKVKVGPTVAMWSSAETLYVKSLRQTHQFLNSAKNSHEKNKAMRWFDLMCSLDPKGDKYFFERAYFFNQKDALADVNKAMEINQDYRAGYLKLYYSLEGLTIAIRRRENTDLYLQKLRKQSLHPSLFSEVANAYVIVGKLEEALSVYERNFFATQGNFELFSEIFTRDLQMVNIYLKQKDRKTATVMLEYLYQIFRRGNYTTNKRQKFFVKMVKEKLPNFVPFIDNWSQEREVLE
ncbi:serine/threonine protein kinase [Candidatus Uabimicrobium amorphum]|uniref:Protein kinase n=1 Tax=Uabimicrobium amorphum TaxID=2596890 RepID=A0A5S9IIP4_UABAM|nr:serine/threonine-protein kinase [Candidatus Uabimicrobium amorphum]BBM82196.1 protein kinase [Candidatus Uabimicrobium amorphum]